MVPMLLRFFFPSSFFIKAMPICVVMLGYVGLSEIRGKHLQRSKFLNVGANNPNKKQIQVSSRTGTLIAYTLSFLAGAVSFGLFPNEDLGFLIVESTLTLHFLHQC
jgi:very-long-chain enoyl-CoA reductase|uniref:Uncharacterized protein n=1 Tax=Populus trichocarpa TaxID=3694 RepID=A0A2K1Z9Z1_POPTR